MPSLSITHSIRDTDIANNRTLVRINLVLYEPSRINFSTSKSGKLQGQSFTYTSGASGSGTWTLRTRDIWVGHNSDGTKTIKFTGSFNIAISYSGSWIGTLYADKTVTLPPIPRNSKLTSFSIANSFKAGTENKVNLGINRNFSGYTHTLDLKYGNTTVASWSKVGTPPTLDISASEVNNILSLAKNTTAPTLNLIMSTRDSSNRVIGSMENRSSKARVSSTVAPSISGLNVAIAGSGCDKTINKYVQGISRVTSSFSGSAGYGASVSEYRITVEKTDGSNAQIISSNDGTTSNAVSGNGNYRAVAYVRDSRGRTDSTSVPFTVVSYSNPSISVFNVVRRETNGTIVDINRAGSWSDLGGQNKLNLVITKKALGDTYSTSVENKTLTSGSFAGSISNSGVLEASTYDFEIVIRDDFGSEAVVERTIGTAKTVFDVHENLGVGIGKRHEDGALDVGGNIILAPEKGIGSGGQEEAVIDFRNNFDNTFSRIWHRPTDNNFGFYLTDSSGEQRSRLRWENDYWNFLNIDNEQGVQINGVPLIENGSNSNGNWIKFFDGTLICQHILEISGSSFSKSWGSLYYEYLSPATWTYPKSFSSNPTVSMSPYNSNMFFANGRVYSGSATGLIAYRAVSGKSDTPVYITAIGRWK